MWRRPHICGSTLTTARCVVVSQDPAFLVVDHNIVHIKIIHKHKLHPKATYCNGNFLTNQMKHHCYTETPDQFQTIRKTSGYSVDWTVDGHDHGFSDGYYGGRAAAFSRRSEPNCGKKWELS